MHKLHTSGAGWLGAAERRFGRGRSAAAALDAGAGAAARRAPQVVKVAPLRVPRKISKV